MTASVTSAVLPVTLTIRENDAPSVLVEMVKSRVFQADRSWPLPACRTRIFPIRAVKPRSTCRYDAVAVEHHLSPRPPPVEPLTALAGPSVARHGAEPVAV